MTTLPIILRDWGYPQGQVVREKRERKNKSDSTTLFCTTKFPFLVPLARNAGFLSGFYWPLLQCGDLMMWAALGAGLEEKTGKVMRIPRIKVGKQEEKYQGSSPCMGFSSLSSAP